MFRIENAFSLQSQSFIVSIDRMIEQTTQQACYPVMIDKTFKPACLFWKKKETVFVTVTSNSVGLSDFLL